MKDNNQGKDDDRVKGKNKDKQAAVDVGDPAGTGLLPDLLPIDCTWNAFQRAFRGQGLSSKQRSVLFKLHTKGKDIAEMLAAMKTAGGAAAAAVASAIVAAREVLAALAAAAAVAAEGRVCHIWNAFQMVMAGNDYTSGQLSDLWQELKKGNPDAVGVVKGAVANLEAATAAKAAARAAAVAARQQEVIEPNVMSSSRVADKTMGPNIDQQQDQERRQKKQALQQRQQQQRLIRELMPDDEPLLRVLSGFTQWVPVQPDPRSLDAARPPELPGVYEWAVQPPLLSGDGGCDGSKVVFYLGRAGNLRERFNAYVSISSQALGPQVLRKLSDARVTEVGGGLGGVTELRKAALWLEMQARGFVLFYRYREAPTADTTDAKKAGAPSKAAAKKARALARAASKADAKKARAASKAAGAKAKVRRDEALEDFYRGQLGLLEQLDEVDLERLLLDRIDYAACMTSNGRYRELLLPARSDDVDSGDGGGQRRLRLADYPLQQPIWMENLAALEQKEQSRKAMKKKDAGAGLWRQQKPITRSATRAVTAVDAASGPL